MRGKLFILLFIFIIVISLIGCQKKDNIIYYQMDLQRPERIEIRRTVENGNTIYDEDSQEYLKVYESLKENWWMYSADSSSKQNNENLIEVKDLNNIETTTQMRYADGNQITISFIYENSPMLWTTKKGNSIEITKIEYFLPTEVEENMNTKGIFRVIGNRELPITNPIYAYYYSHNLYNAISESKKSVSTIYSDNALEINVEKFEEITVEKMLDVYRENYLWTDLKEHKVFWNWENEQVVINHVFATGVSEEILDKARGYSINMELYKDVGFDIIGNSWSEVPNDAEIIIQVFLENELISQSIYSDVESAIPYKQIHYKEIM